MTFGQKLKELRIARNLTQTEVANGTGISPSAIGMLEQGRRKPSFEVLESLADFFNVDLNTLTNKGVTYYTDPEVAQIAEELRSNSEMRILFDASKDLTKNEINFVIDMINTMKKREDKL